MSEFIGVDEAAKILGHDVSTRTKRQSFTRWLRRHLDHIIVCRQVKCRSSELQEWIDNNTQRDVDEKQDWRSFRQDGRETA